MLRKHRVCQPRSNSWRTWQLFPPPTCRKFPRKCLLTSWHDFLPALTIVLMVPQTPHQTAQGWRSSFFMGHSCCCFKSHHSFISSAFRGSFCLPVVFSWVVQNPQLCSAVVLLGGGGTQPCSTWAAIPLKFQTSRPINYHLIPLYVQQWGSVHGQCWKRKWNGTSIFLNNPCFLHHSPGLPQSLKAAQKANTSCGFWLTGYLCSQADVVKMFCKCCLETSLLILFLLSPGSRTSLRAD